MTKYFTAKVGDAILDLVACAEDAEAARAQLAEHEPLELHEMPASVAQGMRAPDAPGVYRGVILGWIIGPTNLLGELPSNEATARH